MLTVKKGVPQCSLLAPLLFSIYINELGQGIKSIKLHFYADDTIIYSAASSLSQAIEIIFVFPLELERKYCFFVVVCFFFTHFRLL